MLNARLLRLDDQAHEHAHDYHQLVLSLSGSAAFEVDGAGGEVFRMRACLDSVRELAVLARQLDVGITIDAEEADRLELSLELCEKLMRDPAIAGWGEFGLVIQAYSKRCLPVLVWLAVLGKELNAHIPLRLVKGACWDSEIKQCQVQGLDQAIDGLAAFRPRWNATPIDSVRRSSKGSVTYWRPAAPS